MLSFSSAYFADFEWVEYSIKKNAVFCFACWNFASVSGYTEETFIVLGFSN